jgi:hypothetical protein
MADYGQEEFIPSVSEIPSPAPRPTENFIPQREDPPAPPATVGNYFTPEEAQRRFAQYLPIESTPNDVLMPSDDPRVYTYQMANGNIYHVPAYEEVLQERRSVGEAFNHLVDNFPSRTEVEDMMLGLPQAAYGAVSNMVTGQGTYEDIVGTATGMLGVGRLNVAPENSLGMFIGPKAQLDPVRRLDYEYARDRATGTREEVWEDANWVTRSQGSPDEYTEISDRGSIINTPILNRVQHALTNPNSLVDVKLGNILEHPALFSFYPELRNVNVTFRREMSPSGVFNAGNGGIGVGLPRSGVENLSPEVRRILLHEIQHYIQDREGWQARGMSPRFLTIEPDLSNVTSQDGFKSVEGFWRGIAPDQDVDGNFRNDVDAEIYSLVYHTRDLGKWQWERALIDEYYGNPDRVYNELINNNTRANRTPVEEAIISDYVGPTQRPTGNGWDYAENSTPPLAQYSSDVDFYIERSRDRVNGVNENLNLSPADIDVFQRLGLYSTVDNFNSYLSEAGEVQAENTVLRRDWTNDERFSILPENTEYARQAPWTMFQAAPLLQEAREISSRLRRELQ